MDKWENLKELLLIKADQVYSNPLMKGSFLIILDLMKDLESEEYLLAWEKSGY